MDEVLVDKLIFYGKRWLNRISIALAILLMIPTTAIMATWNTLPTQKLYPVKRYLENIALKIVSNNFSAKADLQAQFVEQRFNETETLLSQSSSQGLDELTQQIKVAKAEIVVARARTGTNDAIVAQKKAEKLAIQLREYDKKLETTKQDIVESQSMVTPSTLPVPSTTVRQGQVQTQTRIQQSGQSQTQNQLSQAVSSQAIQVEEARVEIREAIVELDKASEKELDNEGRVENNGKSEEHKSEGKDDKGKSKKD